MPVARDSAPMESRAPFVSRPGSGMVRAAGPGGAKARGLFFTPYEYILSNVKSASNRGTRAAAAVAVATAVTAVSLLALDLLWLGVVARPLYDSALGGLKRPVVFWSTPAPHLVLDLKPVRSRRPDGRSLVYAVDLRRKTHAAATGRVRGFWIDDMSPCCHSALRIGHRRLGP